jgi:electron transfer flavoprotein alpha subunit
VKFAAIIDGTAPGAERQALGLGAFLREGMTGRDLSGETLIFVARGQGGERLVELAPTRDVRLVGTGPGGPAGIAAFLASAPEAAGYDLLLFAGGLAGTELATRVGCRRYGAVIGDVLALEAAPERLVCRKNVYSGHLTGRFELNARPWCVGIDASWSDEVGGGQAVHHQVVVWTDHAEPAGAALFEDVEFEELPSAGDLAQSRFLVVAGYGAGSRAGVERIAAAAARMGAAFGVSRPVVMNGWAPADRLLGVSGTRAAPAVCIVAGASGAPALHWGIEKAGFIAAINPDDHAPIVAEADVAALDDGVAVIEALADLVAERTSEREGHED